MHLSFNHMWSLWCVYERKTIYSLFLLPVWFYFYSVSSWAKSVVTSFLPLYAVAPLLWVNFRWQTHLKETTLTWKFTTCTFLSSLDDEKYFCRGCTLFESFLSTIHLIFHFKKRFHEYCPNLIASNSLSPPISLSFTFSAHSSPTCFRSMTNDAEHRITGRVS